MTTDKTVYVVDDRRYFVVVNENDEGAEISITRITDEDDFVYEPVGRFFVKDYSASGVMDLIRKVEKEARK